MKSKHNYVVLIDLPEALPFEYADDKCKADKILDFKTNAEKAEMELFNFIYRLERNFNEEISFIGDDVIGEKFYKRFLFSKDGFLEVMYQRPAAIIAHFIDENRAKKFADAMKKAIEQTVKDKKLVMILQNTIEVNKEKGEALTYQKWAKIAKIRDMV